MFTNWLTSPVNVSPDCILEIGPLPSTRFAVHSSLVTSHSGYLRVSLGLEYFNVSNISMKTTIFT